MIEALLNNINQPQIMVDVVMAMIVLLTILSLAIVGIRWVRNYFVENKDELLERMNRTERTAMNELAQYAPETWKGKAAKLAVSLIERFLISAVRLVVRVANIDNVRRIVATHKGIRQEKDIVYIWYGPCAKDVLIFTFFALIGVAIISHLTEFMSLAGAWGLWVVITWILLWNFPHSGLNEWEHLLTYGIPRLFGQLAASIVSSAYYHIKYSALLGLGVFMSFKYALLPMYAPADAPLLENIILFAIVAHFAWYFPYFGPRAIWHRLPTSPWLETEEVRGKDIPAQVYFNVEDGKAVVNIAYCTVPIRGSGHVWVLRESWRGYDFKFEAGPGKEFNTELNIKREYANWDPIWCSKVVLNAVIRAEPKEHISVREYLPDERGIRQRLMESLFALVGRIWQTLLGERRTA